MSELNVSSNFSWSNSSYNLNLGNASLESVFQFAGELNGLSSNGEQQSLVRHSRRKRGLFSLIAHLTIGIVKVVKAAKKAHKAVKRLKKVRRAIQRGKEIFKHGKEIYNQGKEMYKRGKEVIQMGKQKVKAIKEGVNTLKDKFGNMKDKYEEIRDKVTGEITGYKEKLSGKITDLKKEVTDKVNEITGDAKEKFNNFKKDVTGKYKENQNRLKCELDKKYNSLTGGSDEDSECVDKPGKGGNPGGESDEPSSDNDGPNTENDGPNTENDGPNSENDGPSNENDGPGIESSDVENSENGEGEYEEGGEEESDAMADDVKATLDLAKQNNELLQQQSEAINKNYEAIEQNGRNIDRNYDGIKKNGLAIEKNFDAIQHNTELLDRNYEEVQKNGEAIAKNGEAIQHNTELLNETIELEKKNGEAIAQNLELSKQNQEEIKKNGEAIAKNSELVIHNTELINRNYEEIEKNNKEIQKNGEAIEQNNKDILRNREEIEQNHQAIDRNYEGIKDVEYKVTSGFEVQLKKFEEIQQTMTEALDTLQDVKVEIVDRIAQAEAEILKKMHEIATKPTYSKLNTFFDYFLHQSNDIRSLPLNRRIHRLEDEDGIMHVLQESNKPGSGTLYSLLWDIINQDFAIPKDKDDQMAFSMLEVLCYGMQVYTLIIYFMMEQYGILSENYYFKSDVDQYNNYYRLSRENFVEFSKSLIDSGRFLDRITEVLTTVKELNFIEKDTPNIFNFCKESIKNLEGIRKSLTDLDQTFDPDTPDMLLDDLDFSDADVDPRKKWKEDSEVSYAIQFFGNDTVISSFVSDWSNGYTLDEFAFPEISVPLDPFGRTRTVFRRFDNGAAQLVALIKDSSVTKFKDINRELYSAALQKNELRALKDVKFYIEHGADVNAMFEHYRRPIHAAAENGRWSVADILIKNGSNVDVQTDTGFTPIYIATEYGKAEFVKNLVKVGANVSLKTNKEQLELTPLHCASYKGNTEIVQSLLTSDSVDVNAKSSKGQTALHYAASFCKENVVKLLIADNRTDINPQTEEQMTPLHLAAINNCDNVVQLLSSAQTLNVNAEADQQVTPLHFASTYQSKQVASSLIKLGASRHAITDQGASVVHHAAFGGNADIVSLVASEDNVDTQNDMEMTPLYIAYQFNKTDAANKLIESCANINIVLSKGRTLLHLAAINGDHIAVVNLIKNGISVSAVDDDNRQALYYAVSYNYLSIAYVLLKKGADPNIADKSNIRCTFLTANLDEKSALNMLQLLTDFKADLTVTNDGNALIHIFAEKGYLSVVKFLIEHGVSVDSIGNGNETPLHIAASVGDLDMTGLLLQMGANVNAKAVDDMTPLHYAGLYHGSVEVVEYLLEKGADINIDSDHQYTCVHNAIKGKNFEIAKFLIGKGGDYKKIALDDLTLFMIVQQFLTACSSGDLEFVKYFQSLDDVNIKKIAPIVGDTGTEGTGNAIHFAIKGDGKLNLVKHLVESGLEINNNTYKRYEYNRGPSLLVLAIKKNKADMVKYLLNLGTDFITGNPLLVAARNGYNAIVKHLLEFKNEDIEFKSFINDTDEGSGETALCLAIKHNGDLATVKVLVEAGAALDFKDRETYNNSLALTAAEANKTDVVMYLIENGVDYKASNSHGGTLLQKATMLNNFGLVEYCLNNVSMPVDAADQEGHTPLFFALNSTADLRVVELLKSKGADSNQIPQEKFNDFLKQAVEKKKYDLVYHLLKNTTTAYRKDYSLMHMAIERENVEMLALLLESDEDYNYKDYNNKTSIDFMIEGKKDVAIKYFTFTYRDKFGKSMLHNVAARGENAKVEFLLKRGAYVNARDDEGNTPLHLAAHGGHLDTVKLLLSQRCANLGAINNAGKDALYQAKYGNHNDVKTYLEQKMNELKPKRRRHVESFDNEQTVSSSGSRPSCWVSDAVGSVLNGLKGVAGQVSQLVTAFSESKHDEIPKSNSVAFESYHHVDGTIMLLDFIVRTVTKSKFISTTNTNSITPVKARAYALSIVDRFENYILSKHQHSNIKHELDSFQLYLTIERYTLSGQFDKMEQHLNSIALDTFENLDESDKHLLARNINNLLIETQYDSDKSQQICNSQYTSIYLPTNKLVSHDITKLIK